MRLDRLVSQTTDLSRSLARRAIRRGRVCVAGEVTGRIDQEVDPRSAITLDGIPLQWQAQRYFMLHKPAGVVCAGRDPRHPTVNALLDEPNRERLHTVGRLDIDATGLVLLTDDGGWSHAITAPRRHRSKVYRVTLAEPLMGEAALRAQQAFAEGVVLKGEARPTAPAQLDLLSPLEARVTLEEGRYHQVKRMFAALGNRVIALHREAIGALQLDPELAPGEYRPLSEAEVALLR
jgi:16S rRNA pseudouridine516 synthase